MGITYDYNGRRVRNDGASGSKASSPQQVSKCLRAPTAGAAQDGPALGSDTEANVFSAAIVTFQQTCSPIRAVGSQHYECFMHCPVQAHY
jgi:hypothetical protein